VTGEAIVVNPSGQPLLERKTASWLLMALLTLAAKVGNPFLWRGNPMRVVAGGAAQSAAAFLVTTAELHLLDVPHGLAGLFTGATKHREELCRGKSWTEVKRAATQPVDPLVANEMALFTDGRTKRGLKVTRIDDGQIHPVDDLLPSYVEFAWPVAPLAADRLASKEGFFVAIDRHRYR
jgi:hypothetical protein